ncbi:hypothetical protein [Vulcanisaeta distributa]|uniref:hypothetical protein n=1 Tax=Vulcanisaeta distributa TaxID=164451 RepID=UPI001FB41AF2|nr:hypothetical protein [Vulcanisaeta distributa]
MVRTVGSGLGVGILGDESFVARVIKLIESESHTSGLTDRVRSIVTQYRARKASSKS